MLLRSRIRARDYESLRHQHMKPLRDPRRQPCLWFDVLRGFAGAWALVECWTFGPDTTEIVRRFVPVGVSLLVLLVGVWVQMSSRRVHDVLFAPLSYCAGVSFALLPIGVSVLTIVFALASLIAFRAWWAFFLWGAVAAGGMGYLMLGRDLWMVTATLVLGAPLVFSWLARKPLRLPLNRVRVRKAQAEDEDGDDASAEDTEADAGERAPAARG